MIRRAKREVNQKFLEEIKNRKCQKEAEESPQIYSESPATIMKRVPFAKTCVHVVFLNFSAAFKIYSIGFIKALFEFLAAWCQDAMWRIESWNQSKNVTLSL